MEFVIENFFPTHRQADNFDLIAEVDGMVLQTLRKDDSRPSARCRKPTFWVCRGYSQ